MPQNTRKASGEDLKKRERLKVCCRNKKGPETPKAAWGHSKALRRGSEYTCPQGGRDRREATSMALHALQHKGGLRRGSQGD